VGRSIEICCFWSDTAHQRLLLQKVQGTGESIAYHAMDTQSWRWRLQTRRLLTMPCCAAIFSTWR